MSLTKIPFNQTHSFSDFFLDYIQQKDTLKSFYHRYPEAGNFKAQIDEKQKSFSQQHRDILSSTLSQQYGDLATTDAVATNIQLLKKHTTFTITTGHQLNIFTGPLYFIYKIVTVINTCKQLKQRYPEYDFVPVYWMASEDHDYDEIKYFRLYGKKYTWTTTQQGAVGRFSTEGFKELLKEIPGDISLFSDAYLKNKTLADAVRHYVNALFGNDGVVVVDGDAQPLKALFTEVMRDDVFNHSAKKLVDDTNQELESFGYKTQVFCRDINFFYLDEQLRCRLEKVDDSFECVDTTIRFDKKELQSIIDNHPEKLSPNVILRPLYQEVILPNLAYVGGPAEVVYWLQLKNVFEHYNTPFPILMPRNFAMVIEQQVTTKLEKTGLELTDFFEEKNYLFNHWVLKYSNKDLSVSKETETIESLFELLRKRAESIDTTLGAHVGAVKKRTLDKVDGIGKKMLRAEKRVQQEKLKQIEAVKDILFPNGSLQERTDNFLNFYQADPKFIDKLISLFDPFDFQFNVIKL